MNLLKFNPQDDCIISRAEIFGSGRSISLKMIIDTGSTYTIIPTYAAHAIGNPQTNRIVEITTGSRVEKAPLIIVPTFKAFGIALHHFPVIVHNLPSRSPIKGLLGLNFLKKSKCVIDFAKNTISIPRK